MSEKNIKDKEQKSKEEAPEEKNIKERLELAEKERDEYLNGWKRAKADLANFKKETAAAIVGLSGVARANFIKNLLPILDALELATKNEVEGIENILSLTASTLAKEGIEIISPANGEEFNPELHESISGEGSLISKLVQKGYSYKGNIIRAARVELSEQ